MADNNSSTLKSYVDSATGLAQRAVGTVTGSSTTQVRVFPYPNSRTKANKKQTEGQTTQDQSKSEHAASHDTAKLGHVTADPQTGATAQDNSFRNTGSWDQTIGSAKESVGNFIGNENIRRQGVEQNAAGKEAEAKGQLKDLGEGVSDRAQGKLGGIGAAIAGDREEEEKWRQVHDEGKVRQRGAEEDIDKKGGA